jgi:carbamoyl-phosphate synthase small subunit
VDEAGLPANLRVTHRSLFDGTVQGLQRTDKPAFCFQGHPEASPGPHDVAPLFDRFIKMMEAFQVSGFKSQVKKPETSNMKLET